MPLHLKPRSVLQLVMTAFLAVTMPMALLLYQSTLALETVALQGREITRDMVALTRSSRIVQTSIIDMERLARQYHVIGDKGLLNVYKTLEARLTEHSVKIRRLSQSPEVGKLARQLQQDLQRMHQDLFALAPESEQLAKRIQQFAQVTKQTGELIVTARDQMDARMQALADSAVTTKQRVLWLGASLIPLTLLLVLLFAYLITKPVRQLEASILRLGDGLTQDPLTIRGPAELARLGEKLNWLQTRLAELETQKQRFLRHISHELKTPLASIKEGTELLSEGLVGELNDKQAEVVEILQGNSQQLQTLIENLLDYNRLQYQAELNPSTFELTELVTEVMDTYRLSLQHKAIQSSYIGPPLRITADREGLRSALSNLVSNAIAYGNAGGHLWIEWIQQPETVQIDVANTGKPITKTEQQRIFEPFYQGRARRDGVVKGSGIGLSVARDCVRLHGGELTLAAYPKADVCFRIVLPVTGSTTTGEHPT